MGMRNMSATICSNWMTTVEIAKCKKGDLRLAALGLTERRQHDVDPDNLADNVACTDSHKYRHTYCTSLSSTSRVPIPKSYDSPMMLHPIPLKNTSCHAKLARLLAVLTIKVRTSPVARLVYLVRMAAKKSDPAKFPQKTMNY